VTWQINRFDPSSLDCCKQLVPPIRAALSSVRVIGEHDGSDVGTHCRHSPAAPAQYLTRTR
jgi:glucose-6-phosphate isomerase